MAETLSVVDRRVIGVLIEKALSTPDQYPLTLNSLVNGCNQKSNRDPRLDLSQSLLFNTLDELRERALVTFVDRGGRAQRYRTTAKIVFGLASEQELAVLAELLLRGFGTFSDLQRRASRMRAIDDEALRPILKRLMEREAPLIVRLPLASGQREARYTHTLWQADETPDVAPATVSESGSRAPSTGWRAELLPLVEDLREKVMTLESRVGELERQLAG